MSNKRNRSEGWSFAKLSGHKNETRLAELINKNPTYRKHLQKRLGLTEEILSCEEGGIYETNTKDIFGKSTKRKTDLIITCTNNIFINISLKKSRGGQAYLIGIDRFIEGFQKQFNLKIDKNVIEALNLFFGNSDKIKNIVNDVKYKNISIKIKKYEIRKNRLTHQTLMLYNSKLVDILIYWFRQNIPNLFLFCFERGLGVEKNDWAHFIFYLNLVEDVNIDNIFSINELFLKYKNLTPQQKEKIVFGDRNGGTTIVLPFGSVQWHLGQLQFRHEIGSFLNSEKIN
jgi:hypothetical protein